jgi:hypothetical protein
MFVAFKAFKSYRYFEDFVNKVSKDAVIMRRKKLFRYSSFFYVLVGYLQAKEVLSRWYESGKIPSLLQDASMFRYYRY